MSTESRVGRIVVRVASPRLATAAGCLVAGMCLWGWSRQAAAVLGTSRQSWTALIGTLSLALAVSPLLRRLIARKSAGRIDERVSSGVWLASVGLVALFAVFPALSTTMALSGLERLATPTVLTSLLAQVSLLTLLCVAGWFIPMVAATNLLTIRLASDGNGQNRWGSSLLLAAAGVASCEFLAVALGGLDRVLLIAGLLGTYALAVGMWNMAAGGGQSSEVATVDVKTTSEVSSFAARLQLMLSTGLIALHGALCLFLLRMIDQLMLPVSWVSAAAVAALAAGIGLGAGLFRVRAQPRRFARCWRLVQQIDSVLFSLSAALLTVVLFEPLVWLTLRVNAEVVSVVWSTACLVGVIVMVIAPVGVATGGLVERLAGSPNPFGLSSIGRILPFAGGVVAACWLAPAAGPVVVAVILTSALIAAASLIGQVRAASWRVVLKPQWVACLLVIAAAFGLTDPQQGVTLAARLLYDTRVFIASQIEERTETLSYLDEARCVAMTETDSGTLTIWKRRACEYEVRRSGVSLGAVSLDTFVAPQRTGETLQTLLPLCLHADAEDVLLLGAGSGATLETSVFFPLRQITCVEPDRRLVAALSQHILSQMPLNPLDDERVSVVAAEPILSVRSLPGTFDIVLASASQPAFADLAATSSREFLAAASDRLSEDGLFCQPLDIVDFGPEAMGAIVQTWQSVFADVTAFEIGPGRLLLVGRQNVDESNRFDGKGFLERLQRPHVRTVLAGLGWDWSTVLKVMAYSHDDLQRAFPSGGQRPNSAVNVAFSSTLPFEVTSWGPKYQNTLARLTEVAGTVQFMTGTAGQDPDVKRRLADLDEQSDLTHDKPDHYWAYRGRVKERIKSAPQSELVQVKGEAPRHTLSGTEKRRLEYFEALGAAAQQQRPTAESLNAVAEFDSPFDPLVSPFLHQEIAELAERDPAQLGGIELWHRLHRAFFASPADRSVRNVSRALELLSEQPELIADAAARGDCLDAVLQILHNRWHNRGDIAPDSSQIVLNDIETSLAAIDAAFEQLADLSEARGMPAEAWPARRLAVEKSLVRPLEAYRSMLLPRHAKRQRQSR